MGVDAETSVAHTVMTAQANAYDVTQAGNLMQGEERRVWGAAGWQVRNRLYRCSLS